MLNRWVEEDLLDVLGEEGVGCIAFSPLAQGMLTSKYLGGVPEGSRASQDKSLSTDLLTEQNLTHIRALNEMAQSRGQSLAQMALAWILRDQRITSVLIGASSVAQARGQPRLARQPRLLAGGGSTRSTSTRSRAASTSGRPPAPTDPWGSYAVSPGPRVAAVPATGRYVSAPPRGALT